MTAIVSDVLTEEQAAALEVARSLARAGIPVFVAPPDPGSATGFALPVGWQTLPADPSVVDRWRPGMALGAVMGHGLDLLDVDPRNGGDPAALNGSTPTSYGAAATPSGGLHSFVASLGAGSRDNVAPGIDVKGGLPDGTSRGFAFLAPTVKPSKLDGTPTAYRWIAAPDLGRLAAGGDGSGAGLAARIRELRGSGSVSGRSTAPEWYRAFLEQREPQSVPAATKAIDEKLGEVATWSTSNPAGFRQTLMRAAMTLGGYVGGGWLAESDAWARLEDAAREAWGAPDEDDRRWIEQGLTDGATSPFHVYTAEDEQRFGEAAQAVAATRQGPSWSPQRALGAHPFDPAGAVHDQEYAEAVAARTAPVLRYGVDTGVWVKRRRFEAWSELPDQAAAAIADVARLMPLGRSPIPKDTAERTEEHWQAARRALFLSSAGSGRIERKFRAILAGGDHPCTVDVSGLDAEPEVLWAGGYPFDLRASAEVPTLAAIHPDTPHLHTAAIAPLAGPTPAWDAFVATVFPDPELRAWALRVLGIALAGYPDAALPVLYGPERTGKTALVTLIVRVLGSYGHAADPRLLGGSDTHASIVYALKGSRLAFIDEGPRRGHLAAERLKQLTGGGQLTGNAMRSNPVTFDPTHTLVMTTNDEPPITDPALRARVRLIPCDADQAAVRAARQAITPAVWEAEAPGVLAALMRETAAWLEAPDSAGMAAAPASVRALVGEMAAGQDPVREWRENCTVPTTAGSASRDLYRRFLAWFEGQPTYRRQTPPSETAFGRSLTEQGFPWFWGGDRGKARFRPLSVMNPGGDLAPFTPSGPGSLASAPTAGAEGLPTVADGSSGQPSAAGFGWSNTVSSTTAEGAEGLSSSISSNNADTPKRSNESVEILGKGGRDPQPSAPTDRNVTSPAKTGQNEPSAQPSAPSADNGVSPDRRVESTARTSTSVTPPGSSPAVAKVAVVVEQAKAAALAAGHDADTAKRAEASTMNRELARLAQETGEPKTALRKQVTAARKEIARLEAVAAAGGPVHALPAIVDREGRVVPVDVETAAQVVRARVAESGALTVDVEHTGYPIGHADYELRSVQLGDAMAAVVLHPVEHAGAIRALLAEAPALHAHSATADLVPLAVAGLLPDGYDASWSRMWDTTIPALLADPTSTGSDPGLKRLASAVLGDAATAPAADAGRDALFSAGKWTKNVKAGTPATASGWAQVATGCEAMLRYAASDVLDTGALARALPTPDPTVAARERLAQQMCNRAAFRGVRLDGEHIARLSVTHYPGRDAAAARVRTFGIENPGSDAQVAAKALELGADLPLTATGKPSVAAGVLDPLKSAPGRLGEFVSAVLDHRHHDTVIGLFLEPFAELVNRGDGRARPTVYTLGTNTGRMSTVRPNLQQLSREGGIRACITADPGQVIISADFSSVELRVAAALSGDAALRHLIAEEDAGRGDGLHWQVARQVWGPDATKAHRYIAKRGVFGRLYGAGIPGVARAVGIDEETARQVVEALDVVTPQLSAWSKNLSSAVQRGMTRFPAYSGRVIHMPRDRSFAAGNYAIQGTARELLIDVFPRWADTRWGAATLIPVHDELLAFVPAEDGAAATAELQRCMAGELFGVPIVSEADSPSFAWADSS